MNNNNKNNNQHGGCRGKAKCSCGKEVPCGSTCCGKKMSCACKDCPKKNHAGSNNDKNNRR